MASKAPVPNIGASTKTTAPVAAPQVINAGGLPRAAFSIGTQTSGDDFRQIFTGWSFRNNGTGNDTVSDRFGLPVGLNDIELLIYDTNPNSGVSLCSGRIYLYDDKGQSVAWLPFCTAPGGFSSPYLLSPPISLVTPKNGSDVKSKVVTITPFEVLNANQNRPEIIYREFTGTTFTTAKALQRWRGCTRAVKLDIEVGQKKLYQGASNYAETDFFLVVNCRRPTIL